MKKRNNAFARLVGLLLVSATVLTLTVAATGGAGTSSSASGGTAASFTLVTLNKWQILYMGVGCEAMLRTGSGVCVAASNPGLVDETAGAVLAGGLGLQSNHLYMATVDSRGVQAGADGTKLLVRGNYSVQ